LLVLSTVVFARTKHPIRGKASDFKKFKHGTTVRMVATDTSNSKACTTQALVGVNQKKQNKKNKKKHNNVAPQR
jgi:hypothetical protein